MTKKNLFKFISLVAVLILLFTACNNNKQKPTSDSEGADTSKPYEIQWYFVGNPNQPDMTSVETELNKYLKEKINATVVMNSLDFATYENRINMMIAGNESLDLMFTCSWAANYKLNAAKGAFLAIDDLLTKYAPKTKALLGEDFLKGPMIDGKLYAIPANKDKAHNWGFVYRADIAQKHNIDMSQVKSFEDLEPILQLIKEKEPSLTPLGVAGGRTTANLLDFDVLNFPAGFFPDSNSDTILNLYETPEYKATLDLARKFYLSDYVRKDSDVAKNFSSLQKDGTFFVSLEQCKPGKADELSSASNGIKFAQQDVTPARTISGDTMGSMIAIPRNSKNPERVMMFVELLNTDPYVNNLVNYGIEGKHYKAISENTIEIIKDAGYTQAGSQWQFGNVFLNKVLSNENPDKFKLLDTYNKSATPSKTLGFNFDSEPVKAEISACENVKAEFIMPLEVGSVDPETTLPKFLDKLKQAGAPKIIAEMQKQYDAWKNQK